MSADRRRDIRSAFTLSYQFDGTLEHENVYFGTACFTCCHRLICSEPPLLRVTLYRRWAFNFLSHGSLLHTSVIVAAKDIRNSFGTPVVENLDVPIHSLVSTSIDNDEVQFVEVAPQITACKHMFLTIHSGVECVGICRLDQLAEWTTVIDHHPVIRLRMVHFCWLRCFQNC